ncbi:MAG: hypothetical protein HY334_03325 [Armatimonadetes bacterium]|nr:hypothetical protein [Armatimonadota bacterium]
MRHRSKLVVVVGLGAFLLALLWWLPAVAYAGAANCGLQPRACITDEAGRKFVKLAANKKIVLLAAKKIVKFR